MAAWERGQPHAGEPGGVGGRSGRQTRCVLVQDSPGDAASARRGTALTAFVDTNVLVRHLTGDPPELAQRAGRFLSTADDLLLPDLILAEVAYVLESFYRVPRVDVAASLRAVLSFDPIRVADPELIERAVDVYDVDRLDFADAYLVACAERTGVGAIASFDRSIDKVHTVRRMEPA